VQRPLPAQPPHPRSGKVERIEVPRDRDGGFVTEVFERYKRMTGDIEEAIL
jgi:putative transposase